MADAFHPSSPHTPDGISHAERETRIETLLLTGLDHYFAGEYDRAIGVWTRVLFLDRGHARARAYIERARSAAAERQRESEELLHRGVAAFERGEAEVARRLLGAAVDRGGLHEVALAYLDRLDRLEAPLTAAPGQTDVPKVAPKARRITRPRPAAPRRSWILPLIVLAGLAWGVSYGVVSWDRVEALLFLRQPWNGSPRPAAVAPPAGPLPVPSPAAIAIWRAAAMFSAGRLREALQALDTVPAGDPRREDADRLRSEIQLALLKGTAPTATLGLAGVRAAPTPGPRPVERDE